MKQYLEFITLAKLAAGVCRQRHNSSHAQINPGVEYWII